MRKRKSDDFSDEYKQFKRIKEFETHLLRAQRKAAIRRHRRHRRRHAADRLPRGRLAPTLRHPKTRARAALLACLA